MNEMLARLALPRLTIVAWAAVTPPAFGHPSFPASGNCTPTLVPLSVEIAPAVVSITIRDPLSSEDVLAKPLFSDPF